MAAYRGEFIDGHPAFPKDSQAKNNEVSPVGATAPKIRYTPEDDKVIDDFLRQNGMWCEASTGWCLYSSRCLQLRQHGIL